MRLDNTPSGLFTGPAWRKQVALLTTENFWWHDTFGAHFHQAPEPELLARLNLGTQILQSQVHLGSSGERQRLALLRLLQNQPKVLLLDEPTANLDRENKTLVEQLILDYLRRYNACALWTSHDEHQIKRIASRHFRITDNSLLATDA